LGVPGRLERIRHAALRLADRCVQSSADSNGAQVCSVAFSDSSLAGAVLQARVGGGNARIHHYAVVFQMRDAWQQGIVVVSERLRGFQKCLSGPLQLGGLSHCYRRAAHEQNSDDQEISLQHCNLVVAKRSGICGLAVFDDASPRCRIS
jgi:hypothetical protein